MPPNTLRRTFAIVVLPILAACSGQASEIVEEPALSCIEQDTGIALPDVVPETSGAAIARRTTSAIWTHNDSGGEPAIVAVDLDGGLLGVVTVTGAVNIDWEDMEVASCDAGSCLYLADVGDNSERRDEVVVYRVPEPLPSDDVTAPADVLRLVLPDGPRDVEAIFVLPGERLYLVTKGRSHPIDVYRYPGELRPDQTVTLERVQSLSASEPSPPDQVTGASASPDGRLVAIRTYSSISLYRVEGEALGGAPVLTQSLRTLGEPQGEAVALDDEQWIVLTSEAARGNAPSMNFIRCPVSD
jgi:hypothetical protein